MTSKSCTPQSRNIPPETVTYSGDGGSGSSVVERTVVIRPSSPLTTGARAAAMAASYRRWNPIWTGTVAPSRRRSSSAPTAPVCATGFSHSGGSPASTQARASSGCASVPAATITPSTPEASSAWSESTPSTPSRWWRSTTCFVFSGTRSVTTSDSIAGMPTSVFPWKAPILPSPMSPIRMLSLSRGEEGRRSGRLCQRRVGTASLLGAVAGVHHQGDAQGVGDRDGDRRSGADAVDERAHLGVEAVDVVQLRELGERVLLGAGEGHGEPAGLPGGPARTPAVACLGQVDPECLREDADLKQAAGAVEGTPGVFDH